MDFKRLNNMTGMDPVLNRRISSIFLNELENFKKAMELLPQSENEEHFQFILHKIRPSMVIFEMESLIRHSELILEKKKMGVVFSGNDED
jgi:hypothetical protein